MSLSFPEHYLFSPKWTQVHFGLFCSPWFCLGQSSFTQPFSFDYQAEIELDSTICFLLATPQSLDYSGRCLSELLMSQEASCTFTQTLHWGSVEKKQIKKKNPAEWPCRSRWWKTVTMFPMPSAKQVIKWSLSENLFHGAFLGLTGVQVSLLEIQSTTP